MVNVKVVSQHSHHYFLASAISLLIHFLLLAGIVLGLLPRRNLSQPNPQTPILQMIEPLPRFMTTEEMPEVEKSSENAPFISDRNTRLSSQQSGDADPLLPTQQGRDIPGIQVVEKPESVANPKPSSQPTPSETKPENQSKPIENAILNTKTFEEKKRKAREAFLAKKISEQQESAPLSFRQEKSQVQGGEAPLGELSVEAQATPLGRYKAKVYQLVGSQWRFMVRRQNSLLSYGTVKMRFWIRSDGALEKMEILSRTQGNELLKTISENSVQICAPYEKFSDVIKQQVGEHLMLEASFTIY